MNFDAGHGRVMCENCVAVEHGALMSRGYDITPDHLPPVLPPAIAEANDTAEQLDGAVRDWTRLQLMKGKAAGALHDRFLSQVEPALFEIVLNSTSQNRAAAARVLGIDRNTLRKKLE